MQPEEAAGIHAKYIEITQKKQYGQPHRFYQKWLQPVKGKEACKQFLGWRRLFSAIIRGRKEVVRPQQGE